MKGLLLKDTYMTVRLCRMFLLLDVVFLGVWMFGNGDLFFLTYPCLLTTMVPMTLISYDEREKWDVFAATLPYSRAQIVSCKYLIGLCLSVLILAVAAVGQIFRRTPGGTAEFLTMLPVLMSACLLAPAVLYPFVFRFGAEKGRVVYYVVIAVVCGGSVVLQNMEVASLLGSLSVGSLPAGMLIAAAVYAGSWLLSIRLYAKREL